MPELVDVPELVDWSAGESCTDEEGQRTTDNDPDEDVGCSSIALLNEEAKVLVQYRALADEKACVVGEDAGVKEL